MDSLASQLDLVNRFFATLHQDLQKDRSLMQQRVNLCAQLHLTCGPGKLFWTIFVDNGVGYVTAPTSEPPTGKDVELHIRCSINTLTKIAQGNLKPTVAFFRRKVVLKGNRRCLAVIRENIERSMRALNISVPDDQFEAIAQDTSVSQDQDDVVASTAGATPGPNNAAPNQQQQTTEIQRPVTKKKSRLSKFVSAVQKKTKPNTFRACIACRASRVRCDCDGTGPCSRCLRLGLKCAVSPPKRRGRPSSKNPQPKDTTAQEEEIVFYDPNAVGTDVFPANGKGPKGSTGIESRVWQTKPRTGACANCRKSKVKCESVTDKHGRVSPSAPCKRCTRQKLPCVRVSSNPGRPLAKHTRELKLPTLAPPDLTTFPGLMVTSKAAAKAQVAGAYPILALDEIVDKFNTMNLRKSPETTVPDSPASASDDGLAKSPSPGDDDDLPKTMYWWCCILLRIAVVEESKSELEECLKLSNSMGIDRDLMLSHVPSEKILKIMDNPQIQKVRREDNSIDLPYPRPPVPDKLPPLLEELAKTKDPKVATLTVYINHGMRSGACNPRFAELFMTDKQLDGFLLNGLAKPWYHLMTPTYARKFFEELTWHVIEVGDKTELMEPIETAYTPPDGVRATVRDRFGRQWDTTFEMRIRVEDHGKLGALVMGLTDLKLKPKSEYIDWPETAEEEAMGESPSTAAMDTDHIDLSDPRGEMNNAEDWMLHGGAGPVPQQRMKLEQEGDLQFDHPAFAGLPMHAIPPKAGEGMLPTNKSSTSLSSLDGDRDDLVMSLLYNTNPGHNHPANSMGGIPLPLPFNTAPPSRQTHNHLQQPHNRLQQLQTGQLFSMKHHQQQQNSAYDMAHSSRFSHPMHMDTGYHRGGGDFGQYDLNPHMVNYDPSALFPTGPVPTPAYVPPTMQQQGFPMNPPTGQIGNDFDLDPFLDVLVEPSDPNLNFVM